MRAANPVEVDASLRQQHFGALLRLTPQAIVVLDADAVVREWNPAAEALLGWTREQLLGQPLDLVFGTSDRVDFRQVWSDLHAARAATPMLSDRLHHDRTRVPVELLLAPIQDSDGSFAGAVGTLSHGDPAAQQDPPPQLATGSDRTWAPSVWEIDETTGLPGRRWLQRRLLSALPAGLTRAVALIDVDAFALVNQVYGPERGDQVLAELARRFTERCSPAVIGRWQADEFVLVLDAADATGELMPLMERAAAAASEPLDIGGHQIRLTLSAGLSSTPTVPVTALVTSATAAMLHAKTQGRDRATSFDPRTMSAAPSPSLRMASDLEHGMGHDELRLHFQPIVDLASNEITGVEALVRWERPGVGLLAPDAFIGVAERTGQIVTLGAWVVRNACEAVVSLAAEHLAPVSVSVNVSARQLGDPGLVPMLRAALEASGCDPRSIVVEVTESALLQDLAAVAGVLEEIRALGIEIDLDDFGTGYSSLLYLKHLPVSRIKIDQAFVAGLGRNVADTAIVTSTIALAHGIGITALAEGVETPEQLQLLRQLGCDYAQGFLLSHPLPRDELVGWLQQRMPSRLLARSGEPATQQGPGGAGAERALRDQIADRRDAAGDRRDLEGDARDRAADVREADNESGDRARDRRDALADARERLANERESAQQPGAVGATASDVPVTDLVQPTHDDDREPRTAGAEAWSARDRAAQDRVLGAAQRAQARAERDRSDQARGPTGAAQEPTLEHAERRAGFDALTGAYLWAHGRAALESEAAAARRAGQSLSVVHLRVPVVKLDDQPGDQLVQDAALVVVANILGAALGPDDVLVRKAPAELVCALRGLSPDALTSWVSALASELGSVSHLTSPVRVRSAVLGPGESVDAVVDRAAGAGDEQERRGGPEADSHR